MNAPNENATSSACIRRSRETRPTDALTISNCPVAIDPRRLGPGGPEDRAAPRNYPHVLEASSVPSPSSTPRHPHRHPQRPAAVDLRPRHHVLDAFKSADQVLLQGVSGITDLITTPGLINLDFADVKSVMSGAGSALMGIGSSRGDNRAVEAAEMAISSPLLEASIDGAHGVLLSISGGSDLGLFEINEAAQLVAEAAHAEANIIFGAVIDDALGDEVRVTVIAAGFDGGTPREYVVRAGPAGRRRRRSAPRDGRPFATTVRARRRRRTEREETRVPEPAMAGSRAGGIDRPAAPRRRRTARPAVAHHRVRRQRRPRHPRLPEVATAGSPVATAAVHCTRLGAHN